jgi:hypothetical protein
MKPLPLIPLGPPDSLGWCQGEPVHFDAAGLPHTRPQIGRAVAHLQEQRTRAAAILADLDAAIAWRETLLTDLTAMEASRVA